MHNTHMTGMIESLFCNNTFQNALKQRCRSHCWCSFSFTMSNIQRSVATPTNIENCTPTRIMKNHAWSARLSESLLQHRQQRNYKPTDILKIPAMSAKATTWNEHAWNALPTVTLITAIANMACKPKVSNMSAIPLMPWKNHMRHDWWVTS